MPWRAWPDAKWPQSATHNLSGLQESEGKQEEGSGAPIPGSAQGMTGGTLFSGLDSVLEVFSNLTDSVIVSPSGAMTDPKSQLQAP